MFDFRAWLRNFRAWVDRIAQFLPSGVRWKRVRRAAKALPAPPRMMLTSLEPRLLPATYYVTTTLDTGAGSLRDAINQVDSSADNTIDFNIPTSDSGYNTILNPNAFTIQPATPLPSITESVTIDGTTEAGFLSQGYSSPSIVIDGTHAGSTDGLVLDAGNSTVMGLAIDHFSGNGISVLTSNSDVIADNYVGVDATGEHAAGNSGDGVFVATGHNTITDNVISGNSSDGVYIANPSGFGFNGGYNVLTGNYIGTDAAGTVAIANSGSGVNLTAGTDGNTIGGTAPGDGNVISGNGGDGVKLSSDLRIDHDLVLTSDNVIEGNYIGIDVTGEVGLDAPGTGIAISAGAASNTIGGRTAGARNIISGNSSDGLYVSTSNNVIEGNYVGTNYKGTTAVGNGTGIAIIGGARNIIGGNSAGARNVISGNGGDGLFIGGSGAMHNLIEGNYVGTDVTGTVPLSNGGADHTYADDGIALSNGATSNTIGGMTAGAGNIISGNTGPGPGAGLYVSGSNNLIEGNYVGTDVTGTVAVGNDFGVYLTQGASGNTIGGTTVGARNIISGNTTDGIFIEFGGTTSQTSDNVIEGNFIGTDVTGTLSVPNNVGVFINAAANNTIGGSTDGVGNVISGNTTDGVQIIGSEATGNVVEGNFIGTDVTGTLALANATGIAIYSGAASNRVGGATSGARNVISGNAGEGLYVAGSPNTLIQGNYIGTNAAGTGAVGNLNDGIDVVDADNTTIGGTTTGTGNLISGNDVGVYVGGSSGTVVDGNYVGTDVTGTVALGNSGYGIDLEVSDSNTIGGTTAASGNVISGNSSDGLYLFEGSSNTIQSNIIGLGSDGTTAVPNQGDGIDLATLSHGNPTMAASNVIQGNVISDNAESGIQLSGFVVSTVIAGNYVGTEVNGTSAAPNADDGVLVESAGFIVPSGNTIGGTAPGAGNVIAYNTGAGVQIGGSTSDRTASNSVEGNSIYANTAIGIGLGGTTFIDNDQSDNFYGHNGPNLFQDYPVIASALISGGDLIVSYADPTDSGSTDPISVDFYVADGSGQGKTYFTTNTTSGTVNLGSAATLGVSGGNSIVATATDANGNSSEFSPAFTVTAGASVFVVTDTGDSIADVGSLRYAITEADATSGAEIAFNIPTSDSNYHASTHSFTISPTSALPAITSSVTIDGTTEWAYLHTNYDVSVGTPVIVLSGSSAGSGSNGLVIESDNSTVTGLVIDNFQVNYSDNPPGGDAIVLDGAGATNDVVEGGAISPQRHLSGHFQGNFFLAAGRWR